MRRFSIQVDGGPTWDSQVSGQNDPGAPLVELSIPVVTADLPMGGALVRVWGVDQSLISQKTNLKNKNARASRLTRRDRSEIAGLLVGTQQEGERQCSNLISGISS